MGERKTAFIVFLVLSFLIISIPHVNLTKAVSKTNVFPDNHLTTVTLIESAKPKLVYTNDFVIDGNNISEVKDTDIEVSGNVILKENATLILENSNITILQNGVKYSYKLLDSSKLILREGSHLNITGFEGPPVYLQDESTLNVTNSFVGNGISAGPRSTIYLKDSEWAGFLGAYGQTSVLIQNSTQTYFKAGYVDWTASLVAADSATVQIIESTIKNLEVYGHADVQVADSVINGLTVGSRTFDSYATVWIFDSPLGEDFGLSLWHSSTVWLVNSPLTGSISLESPDCILIFGWYLDVHVASADQPVEGAEVEVYYSHNGSMVEKGTTDVSGNIQFVLPEKTLSKYEGEKIEGYTVKASNNGLQGEKQISLNSSKQITVNLKEQQPLPNFNISLLEIIGLLIVSFMAGVAVSAVIFRRTRRKQV